MTISEEFSGYTQFYRVCRYAYYDNYEPNECVNLLNSKGLLDFTVEDVEEAYEWIYIEDECK